MPTNEFVAHQGGLATGSGQPAAEHNALVEFILELLGDPDKAESFNENPGKCLDAAGFTNVSTHEVHEAVEQAAQSVPAPSGGTWQPSIPTHGSAASIIQQITNNYYQQIANVIGNNNTVNQTAAFGAGSVAVGGDAHGPIATGHGVAGEGNNVGNTDDDHSKNTDASVHGDGSGNASSSTAQDNSRNDSHNRVDVSSTNAPSPLSQPAAASSMHAFSMPAIGVDPTPMVIAQESGGDLTQPHVIEPFTQVPATLISDKAPLSDPAHAVADGFPAHHFPDAESHLAEPDRAFDPEHPVSQVVPDSALGQADSPDIVDHHVPLEQGDASTGILDSTMTSGQHADPAAVGSTLSDIPSNDTATDTAQPYHADYGDDHSAMVPPVADHTGGGEFH